MQLLFIILTTVLLGMFSPIFGLIFGVAIGGKYLVFKVNHTIYLFSGIVLVLGGLKALGAMDWYDFADSFMGIGISLGLFFALLFVKFDYLKAIVYSLLANVGYATVKQVVYPHNLEKKMNAAYEAGKAMLKARNLSDADLQFAAKLLADFTTIMAKYYVAIWTITIGVGLFIGSLMLSRHSLFKWNFKKLMLSVQVIYIFIVFMVLMLIPRASVWGVNGFVIICFLYLMQGFAILAFYWGKYLSRSFFLMTLLALSVIINPYLLGMIILTGLLDQWFDFRKINEREESRENHPD